MDFQKDKIESPLGAIRFDELKGKRENDEYYLPAFSWTDV